MTAAVADRNGTPLAMGIPLMGFLLAWSFPIYLNLYQRHELDTYFASTLGLKHGESETKLEEGQDKTSGEIEKDEEIEAANGNSKEVENTENPIKPVP